MKSRVSVQTAASADFGAESGTASRGHRHRYSPDLFPVPKTGGLTTMCRTKHVYGFLPVGHGRESIILQSWVATFKLCFVLFLVLALGHPDSLVPARGMGRGSRLTVCGTHVSTPFTSMPLQKQWLLRFLRLKFRLVFALSELTSICGNMSKFPCLETICCVCARRPSSTQRVSGLGLVGQLCCRRWYTYSNVMSVHRGPKKRPAASIWPCLPAATPATPPRGMETPLVDQGPTLGTQAPPVKLSGQLGELEAELGVGWTGEGNPPPGVASPRQLVILPHSRKGPRP